MSVTTGADLTVIACNIENCRTEFTLDGEMLPPDRVREKAILAGWVSIRRGSRDEEHFCPRHAYGSKRTSSPGARIFQPPGY